MKTHWRIRNMPTGERCLVPADRQTEAEMRTWERAKVRAGELRCPRNPGFHRLAHAIGGLAADNLDEFEGMDGHAVLKRLQIESGIGCDEMAVMMNKRPTIYRVPRSLSFSSMGQDEFKDVMTGLCAHLCKAYWPETDVDEVLAMAEEWERA
jgi:hypothetical protein